MKKLFTCLLLVTVMLCCASVLALAEEPAAPSTPAVEVNGVAVEFPTVAPFVDANGRTLVPLRPIANAVGMEVEWYAEARQAIFTKVYTAENARLAGLAQESVIFTIGQATATHSRTWTSNPVTGTSGQDSEEIEMNTEAIIVDGSTYAPVRYLVEAIGGTAGWVPETRTVVISLDAAAEEPAEGGAATTPEPTEQALTVEGVGTEMKTQWFNFTVKSITVVETYAGYQAKEGHVLYDVLITQTGTFSDPSPMGTYDFYMNDSSFKDHILPLDPLNNTMMPLEYNLTKDQTVEYHMVYEVPNNTTDLTLYYTEIDELDDEGETFTFVLQKK